MSANRPGGKPTAGDLALAGWGETYRDLVSRRISHSNVVSLNAYAEADRRQACRNIASRKLWKEGLETAETRTRVADEIAFAMQEGSLSSMPWGKALAVGIKLVHEGRWQTPYGYPEAVE